MKKIPIKEAQKIAEKYGYAQIIILALETPKKQGWLDGWKTTFNQDKTKCQFLGKVAEILAYNFRAFYSDKKITEEYYKKIKTGDK